VTRKTKEQAPLPPMPDTTDGEVAGQGWLLAMKQYAKAGDERAADALRSSRPKRPELWDAHRLQISNEAVGAWLDMFGEDKPGNAYYRTAMRHDVERLREELMDGSDHPLDRLMVDRIICCHLAVSYYEALYAQAGKTNTSLKVLSWYTARIAEANRAFARACESFARVRRLRGPVVAVNIEQMNVAAVPAPATPASLPETDSIEGAWQAADPVPAPASRPLSFGK
jgi:hypothetical protein